MKRNLIAALLLMLATAAVSTGQTGPGDTIVNVPFSFFAGQQQLPPGRYIVSPLDETNVRIFSSHTKGALVATHAAHRTNANGSKLVFHRYGDRTFLSSIWISGSSVGRDVYPSRSERDLIQQGRETEVAEISLSRESVSRASRP